MTTDEEIKNLKEKVQILHERLEIVENAISNNGSIQLKILRDEILNIKIALNDIREIKNVD